MASLKCNIEMLKQAEASFKKVSANSIALKDKTNTIANELEVVWDGAASEEFIRRLRNQAQKIADSKATIDELRKYSKSCREDLEKVDKAINAILSIFDKIGILDDMERIGILDAVGIHKTNGNSCSK